MYCLPSLQFSKGPRSTGGSQPRPRRLSGHRGDGRELLEFTTVLQFRGSRRLKAAPPGWFVVNQGRPRALVLLSLHTERSAVINFLWKAFKPRTDVMDKRRPNEDFTCPKCGAEYKVVRMPAPAGSRDSPLHCKICNQEFASTDGENILKYFLVSRRRRSRPALVYSARIFDFS